MQEYTSPGEIAIDPSENLTRALYAAAERKPDHPALAHRVGDRFVEWSNRQFADEVLAVAKGLVATGIRPGDRVALHSSTRIEWTVFDFAIWTAGAVTVPIYETSSAEQIKWIVEDSEAKAFITENDELNGLFQSVAADLPGCEHTFVIEGGAVEQLKQAGASEDDAAVRATADAVVGADLATIVYTSGTTGRPKGCLITHGNFVWDATQVEEGAKSFFRETRHVTGISTLDCTRRRVNLHTEPTSHRTLISTTLRSRSSLAGEERRRSRRARSLTLARSGEGEDLGARSR